tara:strand:+ start:2211 stop:2441 length:231 start_codon:yes stop_codon:yes gene_type:complete
MEDRRRLTTVRLYRVGYLTILEDMTMEKGRRKSMVLENAKLHKIIRGVNRTQANTMHVNRTRSFMVNVREKCIKAR